MNKDIIGNKSDALLRDPLLAVTAGSDRIRSSIISFSSCQGPLASQTFVLGTDLPHVTDNRCSQTSPEPAAPAGDLFP